MFVRYHYNVLIDIRPHGYDNISVLIFGLEHIRLGYNDTILNTISIGNLKIMGKMLTVSIDGYIIEYSLYRKKYDVYSLSYQDIVIYYDDLMVQRIECGYMLIRYGFYNYIKYKNMEFRYNHALIEVSYIQDDGCLLSNTRMSEHLAIM